MKLNHHSQDQTLNCYTVVRANFARGIALAELEDSRTGIVLTPARQRPRGGVPLAAGLGPRPEDRQAKLLLGRIDAQRVIEPPDASARQILVLVPGLREAEHLHGAQPTEICFHDEYRAIGGSSSTLRRGNRPALALLALSWTDDHLHFHDAPAVRIRTTGQKKDLVLGLSAVDRDPFGWPRPWLSSLAVYDTAMRAAAHSIDLRLLRPLP